MAKKVQTTAAPYTPPATEGPEPGVEEVTALAPEKGPFTALVQVHIPISSSRFRNGNRHEIEKFLADSRAAIDANNLGLTESILVHAGYLSLIIHGWDCAEIKEQVMTFIGPYPGDSCFVLTEPNKVTGKRETKKIPVE